MRTIEELVQERKTDELEYSLREVVEKLGFTVEDVEEIIQEVAKEG